MNFLDRLGRAYDAGFRTHRRLQLGSDPTFDPLRADPRFIRLVETLRVPNGVLR